MMDKQKIMLIVLVVAVVAGGAGYLLGTSFSGSADRAKLEQVKKMFPTMPDSNSLLGEVKSVSGNVITLKALFRSPFDESPEVKQATVTSNTKIVKKESKSADVLKQEQIDFTKKLSAWKPSSVEAMPILPLPYTEKAIAISDLKVGDQISIEATTKIGMSAKFEAKKIIVQMGSLLPNPASVVVPASNPVPVQ